jgi:hypothetical protein
MGRPRVQCSRAHQQALTIGPFGNTCKEDAVSPKVAIGGCRTHVTTTRGNANKIKEIRLFFPNINLLFIVIYQI